MAESVQIERTTTHDIYTGTLDAILAAGIITLTHLEPQPGRRKGCTLFMPDGSPVPEEMPSPSYLPGHVAVQVDRDGTCTVRRAVDASVRNARADAEPTLYSNYKGMKRYEGSRERLLRDGVPEHWLVDARAPGKMRGRRSFYEGEQRICVSFTERRINVEVTHIDYYRDFGRESYLRTRAEYGLPLIVKKHLTLVWSAPT